MDHINKFLESMKQLQSPTEDFRQHNIQAQLRRNYFIKKTGITKEEMDDILKSPPNDQRNQAVK